MDSSSSSSSTETFSWASTAPFSPIAHSTAIGAEDLPPLPSDHSLSPSPPCATPNPVVQSPLPHDQHEMRIGKTARRPPRRLTPYPAGPSRPYLLRSDTLKKKAEERATETEAEIRAKIMVAAVKAKVVPAAAQHEDSSAESD